MELFFKWIKQNLKIKSFVGTSRNAVITRIRIALCVHLLLSYIKFANRLDWSLQEILRVMQMNLFDRRPILDVIAPSSGPPDDTGQLQLTFA